MEMASVEAGVGLLTCQSNISGVVEQTAPVIIYRCWAQQSWRSANL